MFDTIRIQAGLADGPQRSLWLWAAGGAVALLGAVMWFLPGAERMLLWMAIALTVLALVPVLWREGHTWVILLTAPVVAIDPFPDSMIRAAKYGLVLLAVSVAILKRRVEGAPRPPVDARPFYPAIILLLWFWIRAITGNNPIEGGFEALRMILVASLIYVWLTEHRIDGGRRHWYYVWMLIGMFQIGACLVESVMWGRIRSYGTFASPNSVGAFLIITIALTLSAAVWAPTRATRRISWLAMLPLVFGLYLTGSRASWLASALAVAVIVIAARRWKLLAAGVLTLGMLVGVYLTDPLVHFAVNTVLRVEGGLTHRPMLWDAADRSIGKAPIVGYGVEGGGIPMTAEARYPSPGHRRIVSAIIAVGSPHNFYRELTIETGVIGLTLLIAVILTLICFSYKHLKVPDRWRAVYALAMLATTIAIAVHSYFERSIYMGSMSAAVFYWFVVAQSARPNDPGSEAQKPELN